MKIINVVGARPNFIKIAPLIEEMRKGDAINPVLVHTGQHYDDNMSKLFFDELNLPKPDIYLGVGSASHAQQTAKIMVEFERILLNEQPDLTLVVGDVNSTIACALTSVKLGIPVAHVEAGLRSFDRGMPEEINRVLTDSISDYLFITEESAKVNLIKEGVSAEKIFFVGNVMIDTLLKNLEKAKRSPIVGDLNLSSKSYALLTLHRPSNVDNREVLKNILQSLAEVQKLIKIVWPVHPRTEQKIKDFGFKKEFNYLSEDRFVMTNPLGYLDFLKLTNDARLVLTDSGGIQEETTVLGVPCITLRENTERPVTVSEGTNVIVGTSKTKIIAAVSAAINLDNLAAKKAPEKWDGRAAQRVVEILMKNILQGRP